MIRLPMLACLLLTCTQPIMAESLTVQTAVVERQDIYRWIAVPATTRAIQEVIVHAKIAVYLTAITVDRGSRVAKDDHLASVDVPEMRADRVRLQAELDVAKAEQARLNAAKAKAVDLIVPRMVDEADARVRVAAANLERTDTLLSFGKITAPFSGIVTNRWADPGAFIPVPTSGGTSGALMTIVDLTTIRVIVPVPEKEASFIAVGRPALVRFEALPEPIAATVARHGHVVDSGSGTLPVEVDIANPDLKLMPGMFARVRLATESHPKVLVIPLGAVLTEGAVTSVFTVVGGVAKKVVVKIGISDGTRSEVLSGLVEQDVVAVIVPGLADGKNITPAGKP